MRFRGNWRWWGAGFGALGGVLDTAVLLSWGLDLEVGGRDLTLAVALYLAASFAVLCFLIGHLFDARARARDDARTIAEQLDSIEAAQQAAARNEKLAAIGRLAAGIAHEVRNPLGVIRASASMIQEGFEPDDESYRACRFICEEIDRLNGLITSLLAFARPTEPNREALDVGQVVDRALELAAGDLERRAIAVERDELGSLPSIAADSDLLSQAVLDLLTNAAEAIEREGRIAVRLSADPHEVAIEVADDGPGIAPEHAGEVFEPFFTTKASGTGLGLAMTARIAESHGGRVELVSRRGAGREGRGACFRLRLPTVATLGAREVPA